MKTAFWFFIYYQELVVLVLVLFALMAPLVLLSQRLEKNRPRQFLGLIGVLVLVFIIGTSIQIYQAVLTHTLSLRLVIELLGGLLLVYRLAEKVCDLRRMEVS